MKLRIFILVISAGFMLNSFSSYAETANLPQAKESVQDTGLEFARCSGIYAAVSEVHAATDSPTLAKNTKEQSNGAWLTSAYLLYSTGIIPDWKKATTYAQTTASSEKLSYMASFEKSDANKAIGELTDALKECNKLLELQDKLVQEARLKLLYSQSPQ